MANAKRDENSVPTLIGVSNVDGSTPVTVYADPTTHRLLIDMSGGGTGTVTSVSVVTANGFAGTVATATTTPAITLTTTVTGIIKGNGTALSAAVAGTDYQAPITLTTTGTSGAATFVGNVLNIPQYTGGGGSGTVNSGTATQLAYYATTGTAVSGNANATIVNGALTLGVATSVIGQLVLSGSTSGTTTLTPNVAASGTLTLPAATDTLVGKATTDTFTNKTFDTAGTGNSFSINGVAVTANTGTGAVARATSPTFVTPTLGAATATSINGLTITSSTGTLTITNAKTLAVSNSLTFTGTDGSSVAFGAGGTVLYTTSTIPLTVGTTTITSGTNTRILYNNAGVLGEYTVTGSGTTAVLSTSPTFTTGITVPLVIGGTGTTGTQLTFKTTTGVGTTDAMVFVGGNNGATTFLTLSANAANFGTSAVLTTGTIELGASSDTTLSRSAAGVLAVEGVVVPTISSTNTLTNKRITKRTGTTTSSATPTINTDNVDFYSLTAQAVDITSFTTNLSGTPTEGQTLWIAITGTAARAITWGASFEASTVALPTTTVTTNRLDVGFVWNAATSKWRCVATA